MRKPKLLLLLVCVGIGMLLARLRQWWCAEE